MDAVSESNPAAFLDGSTDLLQEAAVNQFSD
jgi:hypothetical protein